MCLAVCRRLLMHTVNRTNKESAQQLRDLHLLDLLSTYRSNL